AAAQRERQLSEARWRSLASHSSDVAMLCSVDAQLLFATEAALSVFGYRAEDLVDADGWSVEMRVPFSQLRFTPADDQVWGLQLERIIDRRQEIAMFAFSPRSAQGGVASFGDLAGLRGIRPGRPLELVPYVLSQGDFAPTRGNALRDDRELQVNAGLDARYRITSNLTLAATVNPDFGQVEVDPAVINLTAFETRFEEKRPFFVEGSSNFRFGGNVTFTGASAANLLYSRRIGRAPQVGIRADQVDAPAATSIIGAAKLTGKTASGWSLGVVDAVTARERGRFVDGGGLAQGADVEPMTNYFAGRLSRELHAGRSALGAMLTAVNRADADERISGALRSGAYTGGLDFSHEWANRSWFVGGFLSGSLVQGSEQAILLTQRSPTRYLQRPDAEALGLEPDATSLTGAAATVQLRKQAGVHWTGDAWVGTISPGYEINDLGFQQSADRHMMGVGVRYTQRQPGAVFRTWNLFTGTENHSNYDREVVEQRVFFFGQFQHVSYWTLSLGTRLEPPVMSDRFTRGGPLARRPNGRVMTASLTSDPRKPLGGLLRLSRQVDESGTDIRDVNFSMDVRSSPRWNLSLGPSYTSARVDAQFVTAVADPTMTATFGRRYIFAPLDQTELSVVTRLNYTFTPDMTLELYAQPLIAHGDYGTPKQFQKPSAYEFATYGEDLGTIRRDGRSFVVSPGNSAATFRVADRSFTTRSVRGNAVLRWEYRPGSTFYAVWQQERLNALLMDQFGLNRAVGTLFESDANNVLVLKWTYWFNP
ncbi:MAG: hypothetical protein KY464_03360, partial [Gemmatimonadetes bacterium]|nr:hypothetical protein [Gemmatimonadota bacterium]